MANTFVLELEGKPAAKLLSLDSTGINTVALSQLQPLNIKSQKIVTGMPGEVKFTFGTDASRLLLDWLVNSAGSMRQMSGAINVLDARSTLQHRIEFFDAVVTSFLLPGVDVFSKSAVHFAASFRPHKLAHTAGSNKLTTDSSVLPAQKPWNAANFKFRIDGVPLDESAVTKVSAFGLKTSISAYYSGEGRFPELESTRSSYSNIAITVPKSKAAGVLDWAEEVITGKSLTTETYGSLQYLGPGNKFEYYSVGFKGLGIASTTISKSSSDMDKSVIAELYYNSVKLSY